MTAVLIEPDELRTAATEFNTAADDLAATAKRLDETTKKLEGKWAGVTRQIFFRQYKEMRQYLDGMNILMGNIAREMTAMADRYDSVDK